MKPVSAIKDTYDALTECHNSLRAMRQDMDMIQKQVGTMKEHLSWSCWKPCKIWIPRRINGQWYGVGSQVFRKERFGFNGTRYKYGDLFDYLKELDENNR